MNASTQNLNGSTAALDDALLERIVREVVKRLSATTQKDAAPNCPREHRFDQQLITLDTLRAMPADAAVAQVKARAVVTPAAVDELRRLGVTLVRDADGKPPAAPTVSHALRGEARLASLNDTVVIARVDAASGAGWDAASRVGHATINGGLASVLERLKQALSGGGRGLLVTSAPAVAVYYACREGLRAVYGRSASEVADAQAQFAANLLVIDAGGNPQGLLDAFLKTGRA